MIYSQKALQCILLKPCLNEGTCSEDNNGGYICKCVKGFTGPTCNISNFGLFELLELNIEEILFYFKIRFTL